MKNVTSRDFKDWNDEMVRKYDPNQYHHHPNPLVRYIETRRVRSIIGFLDLMEKESLLEVGCGAGNILEGLDCKRIIGIDLSLYILGKAKQKNINNIQLLNAIADNLPFRKQSFNKIICSEVLEHVLNPQKVLEETWRVLKNEGILVISIPNENLINSIKRFLVKLKLFGFLFAQNKKNGTYSVPDDMTDEWHLHKLNFSMLNDLLKNNFKILQYKGIPSNFLPLRYVVQCKKC